MDKNNSLLGFALLGLLHQGPMSGYDLRKVFASTAMGSFSDSPGAIYPALARLEARGLIRGTVEASSSLRKRKLFKLTPKGLTAFKGWVKRPVLRDDVIRHLGDLMLRFAFMDQSLGDEHAVRFLEQFAAELAGYIPSLKEYLDGHANKMPLSGRLALECGVQEYEARLKWARTSLAVYEQRKRSKV
jgi:DNA-binding PadR family transcriptional regulator